MPRSAMPRPCDPAALLLAKRQACRVNDAMEANHCCRAKLNWNYMTSVSGASSSSSLLMLIPTSLMLCQAAAGPTLDTAARRPPVPCRGTERWRVPVPVADSTAAVGRAAVKSVNQSRELTSQ